MFTDQWLINFTLTSLRYDRIESFIDQRYKYVCGVFSFVVVTLSFLFLFLLQFTYVSLCFHFQLYIKSASYTEFKKCCTCVFVNQWWRHQMKTFSASLPLCGDIPHKGQWRGALKSSLICAPINGWVNNREAGDLKRHHAHYDVILMILQVLHTSVFVDLLITFVLRYTQPTFDHVWTYYVYLTLFVWHLYYPRFVLFILHLLLFIDCTWVHLMFCLWIILLIFPSVAYCVYAFNIVRSVVP